MPSPHWELTLNNLKQADFKNKTKVRKKVDISPDWPPAGLGHLASAYSVPAFIRPQSFWAVVDGLGFR